MKKLNSILLAVVMVLSSMVLPITIVGTVAVVGCRGGSVWPHIVTVTEVRDSAMKELAQLSKQGQISEATDAKIAKADEVYRAAAETAAKSLRTYKEGGSEADYVKALAAAKAAVTGILDILTPFLTQAEAVKLNTQLAKASRL